MEVSPGLHFGTKLKPLLTKYPAIDESALGLKELWKEEPVDCLMRWASCTRNQGKPVAFQVSGPQALREIVAFNGYKVGGKGVGLGFKRPRRRYLSSK